MQPVHDALADAEGVAAAPLRHVEPDTARQEFVENGQTGLDELLAALDGDVEVRGRNVRVRRPNVMETRGAICLLR